MESNLERYAREYSTRLPDALGWIEKQTHIRTHYPQMLSGPVRGGLLKMLVEISGAERILEIGTFTGYSAACMALGLPEGGHIDTYEINDEMEDFIREGWDRAGVSGLITLHIGDVREMLGNSDGKNEYDLVYIDANKREYSQYFHLVLPLLKPGGIIITDDVMLGGKVFENPMPQDRQTVGCDEFNRTVARDPGVEVVILPVKDGISIARKKT